mgnify:CR=1 FL=1
MVTEHRVMEELVTLLEVVEAGAGDIEAWVPLVLTSSLTRSTLCCGSCWRRRRVSLSPPWRSGVLVGILLGIVLLILSSDSVAEFQVRLVVARVQ